MKTIEEIKKETECTLEQAEKLFEELNKLPEKLRDFISDNLEIVEAFNADEIEVYRHYDYSKYGANIIVKRIDKNFPTLSLLGTPCYNHWKYCFDYLINYKGVSVY